MELKYINPFIESVYQLFETMLSSKVERQGVCLSPQLESHNELVAVIGLSGATRGNVALVLPQTTALAMVGKFVGEPMREIDDSVIDAVAELVNIIAGGAKAKLSDGNPPITLSLPNVIRTKGCTIHYPTTSVWLKVPFSGELGPFELHLSFQYENGKAEEHSA